MSKDQKSHMLAETGENGGIRHFIATPAAAGKCIDRKHCRRNSDDYGYP